MSKDILIPEVDSIENLARWALGQLAHPFDSGSLVRVLLNALMQVTGSARADLLLYQSDMSVLFFSETAAEDMSGAGEGKISLADTKNSAPVKALVGGHTVLVEDVRDSGLLSVSPASRTLLAAPVVFGDRLHGVLNVEHAQSDAYDSETVRWVEAISSLLAVLLEQSYLMEQVFRLNQQVIDHMAEVASKSDPGWRAHADRVSVMAGALAEALGLDAGLVRAVRESGYLHDVGKSGVSKSILVKPGSLTEEERSEVKRHPVLGRFLLKPLGFQPSVIEGVASHHERWDGEGYPRGLTEEQIPITGRILAVAEAFDVMTSDQPYRKRISEEEAIEEIRNQAGSQFDPGVVDALLQLDLSQL